MYWYPLPLRRNVFYKNIKIIISQVGKVLVSLKSVILYGTLRRKRIGYANIMVHGQREVFEQNLKDIKTERRASCIPSDWGQSQGEAKELHIGNREPLRLRNLTQEYHKIPGTKRLNEEESCASELERKQKVLCSKVHKFFIK